MMNNTTTETTMPSANVQTDFTTTEARRAQASLRDGRTVRLELQGTHNTAVCTVRALRKRRGEPLWEAQDSASGEWGLVLRHRW